MTKITWGGLSKLEQELVVQAEIYAQVRVEYVDNERLDAAENLRGEGLLYTYDTTGNVKIFEITDDGREVYKQGEATAQPAASATAADGEDRLEVYRDIFHDVIAGHLESTPQVMAEHGLYLLEHTDDLRAKLASAEAARDAAISENLRLRYALTPFGVQWSEWVNYVGMNGEMGIVEFFSDYMDDGVLERDLSDAAKALTATG